MDTLALRGMDAAAAPAPAVALGGAAAMGITPLPPLIPFVPTEEPAEPWYEVGVEAVLPPAPVEPVTEGGEADSLTERARMEVGVVACAVGAAGFAVPVTTEFLRVLGPLGAVVVPPIFLELRVDAPPDAPTGIEAPDPRLRFLITSVFNDRGRTTP